MKALSRTKKLEDQANEIDKEIIWTVINSGKEIYYINRFYFSLYKTPALEEVFDYCFDVYNHHLKYQKKAAQAKFLAVKYTLRKISDDFWEQENK